MADLERTQPANPVLQFVRIGGEEDNRAWRNE
jgi:hypothetical protein